MEITEKHLQDAFDRLEEYSIIHAQNNDEAHGILFAAGIMKDHLRCVLKAKSEEDYMVSKEYAKECMRILREMNGDLPSYKYKCGHGIKPIILNTTVDSLATYMEWKNSGKESCIECWLKQREKK